MPPDELAERKSMKGTATNFPLLDEVSAVEVLGGVVALALELALELAPAPLVEITAKSMRPEPGFTTISLMVPRVWPWLLFTSAFMSLLALVSCCPIRP